MVCARQLDYRLGKRYGSSDARLFNRFHMVRLFDYWGDSLKVFIFSAQCSNDINCACRRFGWGDTPQQRCSIWNIARNSVHTRDCLLGRNKHSREIELVLRLHKRLDLSV